MNKITRAAIKADKEIPAEWRCGVSVATVTEAQPTTTAAPSWLNRAEPDQKSEELSPVKSAKSGAPYAMTDLGNAERLTFYHGEKFRWDVALKAWRDFDGKRWTVDRSMRVNALAATTARYIRKEAAAAPPAKNGETDLGQKLFQHAVRSESRDRLSAMIDVAKACPGVAVAADSWDADPMLLNVNNGTIDLRTGELSPHNRNDMITKLAPVDYIKGHTDTRLDYFLKSTTGGDSGLIEFLQTFAGYVLTGNTSEEKLAIVYGPEATGKSTFLDMIQQALGDYARTVTSDLLTKKRDGNSGGATPELASLAGARLVAASEMEQGREIAEALVKNMTGGEMITARHLYGAPFSYRPQFKPVLALNHCPRVSAEDGAMWRRILRIGFDYTVPADERDKTLKPYLRDPDGGGRAVLAWAVEGCLRWQRDGLTIPEAVRKSTAAYRQESDPLAAFVEDSLSFNPSAWTSWHEIWEAYNEHAEENGTKERFRVNPKRLQERLKDHECQSEKRKIGRGWRGVELSEVAPVAPVAPLPRLFPHEEKLEKLSKVTPPPPPPPPDVDFTKEIEFFNQAKN